MFKAPRRLAIFVAVVGLGACASGPGSSTGTAALDAPGLCNEDDMGTVRSTGDEHYSCDGVRWVERGTPWLAQETARNQARPEPARDEHLERVVRAVIEAELADD
jgi:hypothetical protein